MNFYEAHPLLFIPFQVAGALLIFYVVALRSGWSSLSRYCSTDRKMPVGSFLASNVAFRYGCGYNNVVRLGSDSEGLYLFFWPRLAHPRLFIPWREIEIQSPKRRLFMRSQRFILGRETQIAVTLREKAALRLLANTAASLRPN